jgi:hypothetical protein
MRNRWIAPVLLALALPAAALADIGPHSSLYDQGKLRAGEQKPNVSVLVDRRRQTATVDVQNYCLGAQYDGGQRFPRTAEVTVHVRHGKLEFRGKARLFAKPRSTLVAGTVVATIKPKRASGYARFPSTKCGTIRFVAPLVERTS